MPRVPSLEGPQVSANTLSLGQMTTTGVDQLASQAGRTAVDTGRSMTQLAGVAGDIATDLRTQADQVQLNDAMNAARRAELDLTFNPQTGYKALKGRNALDRPDNQALPDEYGAKLKTSLQAISEGLGNENQRRAFAMQSNDLLTRFQGDTQSHMLGEFRSNALSSQEGSIKIGIDTAKLNWRNPDKINESLESVKAAVYQIGQINGEAGNVTAAKMKEATSAAHISVIQSALEGSDPEYALAYMTKNKDSMTADDLLRSRSVIDKDVIQRVADGVATNVVTGLRARSQPTDLGRMAAITAQSESGSRERGPDGALITSVKGAQGAMQVMPGTRLDPGFGVTAAKDDSDAERTRVGKDYLDAMVKHYAGDPAKAWAAYNWGPGNLDAALKEHGGDWFSHLPKETQVYVNKNLKALETGGGAPAKPTLQEAHDNVRAQITAKYGATPPAGILKQALASTTQQFEDLAKATKADEDARTTAAMQAIQQAGGRFSDIPYAIRSSIPADQVDKVLAFGERIAKGDNITNPAVYQRLSDPKVLTSLSENEMFQMRAQLSVDDYKHFVTQRNAAIGKSTDKMGEINTAAIDRALANRFKTLGIDPTPKDGTDDAARLGVITKMVTDVAIAHQRATGKTLTDVEVEKQVDGMFAKSATFRTSFFGLSRSETPPGEGGDVSQRLMTMKVGDIPSATRDELRREFKAAGVTDPVDSDILGAYLRLRYNPQRRMGRSPNGREFSGTIKPMETK